MLATRDKALFFRDLGVEAIYTHAGDTPKTIKVILTETATNINGVRTKYVTAQCDGDDVADWEADDTMTISGTTYFFIDEEEGTTPDMPVIVLSRSQGHE